jgi:hypothetical protein
MCRPDTPVRNSIANQMANITSAALSTIAATKLGYHINPLDVVNMRLGGMVVNNVMKMAQSSPREAVKCLPELATAVGLSGLFILGAREVGYEVDPMRVIVQQVYNIGISYLLVKAIKSLKTEEEKQTTPVPQGHPVDEAQPVEQEQIVVKSEG